MANRILQYVGECDCCRATKRSAAWRDVAERLEQTIGDDVVEAVYPSKSDFIDDDADICISFYWRRAAYIQPLESLTTAATDAALELRRIASVLTAAACRLEGGAK